MYILSLQVSAAEIRTEKEQPAVGKTAIDASKQEDNLPKVDEIETHTSLLEGSMPSIDVPAKGNDTGCSILHDGTDSGGCRGSNDDYINFNDGRTSPSVESFQEQSNSTTDPMAPGQELKYWIQQRHALSGYIQEHGHPPQTREENPQLYDWIQLQKARQSDVESLLNSC